MRTIEWTLPLAAVLFGAFAYAIAWFSSRRFDHDYGRNHGPAE